MRMGRKGNLVIEHNGSSETERYNLLAQQHLRVCARLFYFAVLCLGTAVTAYGQTTDPWSTAAGQLSTAFTGPIAKGFSLVAIVIGGLELAFSEGGGRRTIGGLIFGVGLALGAATFLSWITT
jgi:type IV secretory pathway VirB2 component (pilin)